MKLSVVIPTYNRKDSLRRTLDGLARQRYPFADFEAVVVSDGSTDGTAEMLADYARAAPYSLRVICQTNGGPSKARNLGIQEAHNEVIVFLDDDVEPVPEFLTRHAIHHQQEQNVAVLGPMSPDPARSTEEPAWIAWEHAKLQEIYAMFRPGGQFAGCPASPVHFYSGNASVRREWLLATGGFDESYTRQEDVELAVRLQKICGVVFCFDFAADGLHRPQRSFASWLRIPNAYGTFDAQRISSGLLKLSEVQNNIKKRNVATRVLATVCLRFPFLLPMCVVLLHQSSLLLYRLKIKSASLAALSALYNICYIDAAIRPRSGESRMILPGIRTALKIKFSIFPHRKIDVLYVGFVLGHGGDAIQMLDLAEEIARTGLNVKIITPDLPTAEDFIALCAQRKIHAVKSRLINAHASQSRQKLSRLLLFFALNHATILHLHTGDVCLPRLVLLTLRLLRKRGIFVTPHSAFNDLKPTDPRARAWASAAKTSLISKVISPSIHGRINQISYGIPGEKLETITNGIDLRRFLHGNAQNAYATLGLADGTPLLMYTSRMGRVKRPHDVLKIFLSLGDNYPELHLVYVGRGMLEAEMKSLATHYPHVASRIHFVGYQPNIQDWLAAATIWILPTERENFSLAVLEALVAGCAIVSTDCPGNDEVLVNEHNALVTAVGDIEGQTQAVQRLLEDPDLRCRLGGHARLTGQNYSKENMAKEYLRCYLASTEALQQLLAEHR